ncbi:FHA domain-containing protein [Streptomyces sp. NBC_00513]|uniref:FHA domain-containing protein n=1 Tax=unclassified Streptomyces TaxID=2593676 RepID=UPI00224F8CA6|nr:FHA domain-containing protein [Streptomyces sp. NBC_00424]MCX5075354.1 FHA domain-containing protein [Streptomyces sp. NBC_00424]WUD41525.1 FHA domain-containing protein [Streptomyces sp. NBC_00513]
MPTCPNGHQSASEDWCEVCGHRMAAATSAPAAPSYGYGYPPTAGEPTAQAELCPQCRTPREAMAPFCEECRYNFLTRSATSYTPLAQETGPAAGTGSVGTPPPQAPPAFSQDHFDYQGSRPSRVNRPAEPLQREDDWLLPPPSHEQQAHGQQAHGQQGHQQPSHQQQSHRQQPVQQPLQQEYQQPHYQQQPPPQQQEYQQSPQAQQSQGQHAQQEYQQHSQHQQQQQQVPQHQAQQHQQQQHYGSQGQAPSLGNGAWSATVGPDRSYFLAMMRRSGPEAAGLNMPAYSPEQHLALSGGQITIGRRRASSGESPDIDLSVPPEDPGVSHQHAVLVQQPDGSWAVVDQNSTNGTTINGGEEPIQPYVPIPLGDGDQVHVGAWTTITVRRG